MTNDMASPQRSRRWLGWGVLILFPLLCLGIHLTGLFLAERFFAGMVRGPYPLVQTAYTFVGWAPFIVAGGILLGVIIVVRLWMQHRLRWPIAAVVGVVGYIVAWGVYIAVMSNVIGYTVLFYTYTEVLQQEAYGKSYTILRNAPPFYDGSYYLLVECETSWRCRMIDDYRGAYAREATLELDDQIQSARLSVEPFVP